MHAQQETGVICELRVKTGGSPPPVQVLIKALKHIPRWDVTSSTLYCCHQVGLLQHDETVLLSSSPHVTTGKEKR